MENISKLDKEIDSAIVYIESKPPTKQLFDEIGSLIFVASYITAGARSLLTSYIIWAKTYEKIYGGSHIFYCDTDSIVVSKDFYQQLKSEGYIDSSKLGALKNELPETAQRVSFVAMAPKIYLFKYYMDDKLEIKFAFKGIKKLKEKT